MSGLIHAFERMPARGGHLDDVAAAILRVSAAGQISGGLELIQQQQTVSAALTGGYQLAFLLAAICVLAGLGVMLMVIRPSGGGARRPSPVELDRAEAEAA